MLQISTLSVEDVLLIHERLTIDAEESEDPISPPGVKDMNLLASAVARQDSGFDGALKYNTPVLNAASLCYGRCCNHPLHNGNKRTALVALLCHLDKNNLTFNDKANQDVLYSFMVNVAGHSLPIKEKRKVFDQSDIEVEYMAQWITRKTRKVEKGERMVAYRDFERLLKQFDVHFENHRNNYVDVVKYVDTRKRTGLFSYKTVREAQRVANIPFWPNRMVGKNLVKSVRKSAGLTHRDGVDSALFYGDAMSPDDFIEKYRKTLSRLAKT